MFGLRKRPEFTVEYGSTPPETLVVGFTEVGMAGLTAANYLADQLGLEEVGHVTAEQLPAITPFERGTPRHHTRLFSRDDLDVTVLVGELFAPRGAAGPLAAAVVDWMERTDVEEVTVLSGVPVDHAPEDHRAFYVATEDYQRAHLQDVDVAPMGGGFLDGINAHLLGLGMDTPLRAGVFVTPAHARTPDVEAAVRLVDAVEEVHEFGVDTAPLEAFAEEVENYYAELASRMADAAEADSLPEDRMFM